MIYLDNAATMPLLQEVKKTLCESYASHFANASAAHKLGKTSAKAIDKGRNSLLKSINAPSTHHLIFTSCATESNNLLIQGLQLSKAEAFLYSHADHPSLVMPIEMQESKRVRLPLHKGKIDVSSIKEVLLPEVKCVVLSHINNQSGVIQPIDDITSIIKKELPEVHIHLDAVQSFSKIEVDMKKLGVDSLSISAHKIGGPKGIAALILPKSCNLRPLFYGGGQEQNLRSGTLSSALILAFVKAAEIQNEMRVAHFTHLQELQTHLKTLLKAEEQIEFIFDDVSAYITTFIAKGIYGDIVLRHLEMHEIYASSSSACSSKVKAKTELFNALDIPEMYHKNVLRVSFSAQTTKAEIEQFVATLRGILEELKGLIK